MRAAFERWYKAITGYAPDEIVYDEGDETYATEHAQGAWEAWQHLWPKRATARR